MKKRLRCNGASLVVCLSFVITLSLALPAVASDIPKAPLPAVITSLGQSPDAYATSVLAKRAKLTLDYDNFLPAKEVSKYKTLLLAVGASLKGFGSAGVNLDTEFKRGKEIVEAAKENSVFLVILHIGGEGRREQMSNKLLDAVAHQGDYLLVLEDGNKDGYFTEVSEKNNIPLTILENPFKIQDSLKELFSGE